MPVGTLPLLTFLISARPPPLRGTSCSQLMINGEGGSCLGNQETQEGLLGPSKSGLEPKKGLVFSRSLATSFPPAGSVIPSSVWRWLPLPPASQQTRIYLLSPVCGGLCQQRPQDVMSQLSVFTVLSAWGRGEGRKKKNRVSMIRKVSRVQF